MRERERDHLFKVALYRNKWPLLEELKEYSRFTASCCCCCCCVMRDESFNRPTTLTTKRNERFLPLGGNTLLIERALEKFHPFQPVCCFE